MEAVFASQSTTERSGAVPAENAIRAVVMSDDLVAVAEGPDGLFATLNAHGTVSVWSRPGDLRAQFNTTLGAVTAPVPSHRLAIVVGVDEINVVVGSWSKGVAAFALDGAARWHRRDIRHVQRLRALPTDAAAHSVVGVVQERAGGLVLGVTGGTKHRIVGARFLAGWPDGSLFVFDGASAFRRAAPDSEPVWRLDLATFALLDAALDGGALISGANRRLTYVGPDGVVAWRTPADTRQFVRVRADPDGDGWICLATLTDRRSVPQVVHVAPDGQITLIAEVPGSWIDFVARGRYLIGTDGAFESVRPGSN